jgi:predicted PurR-regulated permease PerM
MLGLDVKVARTTWTVVAVLLILGAVYEARETFFVLIISIMFAYMLTPMVNLINRRLPGKSRAPGLAITYLALIGVLIVLGIEIGSRVADEATSLVARAPMFVRNLTAWSPNFPDFPYLNSLKGALFGRVQTFLAAHSSDVLNYLPNAGLKVLSLSSYLLFVVLVPILSFFLLKDGQVLHDEFIALMPEGSTRSVWINILSDTNLLLGQYVRAIGTLCLTTFIVFAICLSLFGVPYAILLASIAFPLEFIPLFGPLVAAVIIITVTAATGYVHWPWIILFLAIYRLLQDYVFSPRLMSSGLEVHPLLVILGVLAGEKLGGIPGMFLSVPIIALFRVIYRRYTALVSPVSRLSIESVGARQ